MATCIVDHYRKFFSSQFLRSGSILQILGRQFPITTLMPITISIMLDESQVDAGSLIQAEKNEKPLKEYR